ncbi:hypothetical protein FB451DRAFT_1433442 [Mycena latifolia]|nr:hypothetical protein FB451DRAFT_1433442 [Mycena latifolia]
MRAHTPGKSPAALVSAARADSDAATPPNVLSAPDRSFLRAPSPADKRRGYLTARRTRICGPLCVCGSRRTGARHEHRFRAAAGVARRASLGRAASNPASPRRVLMVSAQSARLQCGGGDLVRGCAQAGERGRMGETRVSGTGTSPRADADEGEGHKRRTLRGTAAQSCSLGPAGPAPARKTPRASCARLPRHPPLIRLLELADWRGPGGLVRERASVCADSK